MFDNLRDQREESDLLGTPVGAPPDFEYRESGRRRQGMTPGQRLLIAILILATVIVVGVTCLLVTQRVWPWPM